MSSYKLVALCAQSGEWILCGIFKTQEEAEQERLALVSEFDTACLLYIIKNVTELRELGLGH